MMGREGALIGFELLGSGSPRCRASSARACRALWPCPQSCFNRWFLGDACRPPPPKHVDQRRRWKAAPRRLRDIDFSARLEFESGGTRDSRGSSRDEYLTHFRVTSTSKEARNFFADVVIGARALRETAVTAAGVDVPDPHLFLLTFSRYSAELDAALLASPLAAGLDARPAWANGAKVLLLAFSTHPEA